MKFTLSVSFSSEDWHSPEALYDIVKTIAPYHVDNISIKLYNKESGGEIKEWL